jgi:hypothetical protein
MQPLGRPTEMKFLGDSEERLKLSNVHGSSTGQQLLLLRYRSIAD